MFTSQAGIKVTDSDDLSKNDFRQSVWTYVTENDIARYPLPVVNRIPNFKGCGQCGNKLAKLPVFISAETIKVNPDKPQEEVRFWTLALRKKLLVPSPRLISGLFNLLENETHDDASSLRRKAQAEGVKNLSKSIVLKDKINVDLIVIGSVAVSKTGQRIGKGEGFADLEYAMMKSMNAINDDTLVVTTVHDSQVFDELPSKLFKEYDVPIDIIVTPTTIINVEHSLPKPKGIYWHLLSREKFKQVPVLKKLFKLEKEKNEEISLMDGYCPSDAEDNDEEYDDVDSKERDIRPKTRGQGRSMRQRGGGTSFHQHDYREMRRGEDEDSPRERDNRPFTRRGQGRSMRQRGGAPPFNQRENDEDSRKTRQGEDTSENEEDVDSSRDWDQRPNNRRGRVRFMRGRRPFQHHYHEDNRRPWQDEDMYSRERDSHFNARRGQGRFMRGGGAPFQHQSYNEDNRRPKRDEDRYGNTDDVDRRDQRQYTRGGQGRFTRQRGGYRQDSHNEDDRENERTNLRERGGRGRGGGWMRNSAQESEDKTNIQVTINVDKQNHIVRRAVEETNQQDRVGDADQNDTESPRSSSNNNFSIFVGGIPKNSRISDLRDELLARNVRPNYIAWKVVGFAFLNFYSYPNTAEEVLTALDGLTLHETVLKCDIDRKPMNRKSDRTPRTENAEHRENWRENSGYAEDRTATKSRRWQHREPVNRPNRFNRDDSTHNNDNQDRREELSIGHFKQEETDQGDETSVHQNDRKDSTPPVKSPTNKPDSVGDGNAVSVESSEKNSVAEQRQDGWGAATGDVDATNSNGSNEDGWGDLSDDAPTGDW